MAKSMKKMLLLAKVETTSGTDSTPTAGANAMLVRAFTPEPIVGDQVARDLIRPYKGNSGKQFVGEYRRFRFEVELAGAGAAGTEPKWGVCLEACGFAKTITAGTDVTYDPVSGGEPTLTMYGYLDGIRWIMTGAKGTVTFTLNAKGIPVMAYEFIGDYVAGTDTAFPTGVDYSGFQAPLAVSHRNTPTFSFHGLAACTSAYSINWAAVLNYRNLINCKGAQSPDRTPTGSVTMELPSIAVKDWDQIILEGTTGAASLVHGLTAGNIVEIQAPQIQCGPYTLQDDQGIAMINMPFDVNPDVGNDELSIIVR